MTDMFAKVAKMSAEQRRLDSAVDHHADRDNYAAYVDKMREFGWTDADVAEYRAEVERIMKAGTEDEKRAASEFWAEKAKICSSSTGVNQRIRASIASDPRNDGWTKQ